jgi:hypothetical protein
MEVGNLDLFKYTHEDAEESFMEIDLGSGTVTWVNKYLKSKCSKDDKSVLNTSIYGLVDEAFRAKLSTMISSHETKKLPVITIWPIGCDADRIAWWKIRIVLEEKNFICCSADLVLFTKKADNSYLYMATTANNLYLASKSLNELDDLRRSLDEFKTDVLKDINDTRSDINASIEASRLAEEAANRNRVAIDELKNQVIQQFNIHTNEIIKLMTSDVIHDSRMSIFEDHVKKTTTQALADIIEQADKSGKGLSKKVTIPAGVIAAIIGFIQWLITYFVHR